MGLCLYLQNIDKIRHVSCPVLVIHVRKYPHSSIQSQYSLLLYVILFTIHYFATYSKVAPFILIQKKKVAPLF